MTTTTETSVQRRAREYREFIKARGDRAEWAAIDGMSDEFVAAVADGKPRHVLDFEARIHGSR